MEEGQGSEAESVPLREGEGSSSPAAEDEISSLGQAGGMTALQWLTVDGALGLQQDEALKLARNYFYGGFYLLPWLWFANCFYFWPVLRYRGLDPPTRFYVLWSAICCLVFSTALLGWSLTFAFGGERVLGTTWEHLNVYNLADKYSMAWAQ